MFLKFKKSISPLIATILLVVVAVAVIGIIVLWGKGFTTDNLTLASQTSKESTLSNFVWQDNLTGTNLIIKNTNATKGETIVAYKINSFADYSFLNTNHTLDTQITLNESSYATINLRCLPEAKFSIDLITSNGDYINVPVTAKFFDATACTFSASITSPENNSVNAVDSEIVFTSSITNNFETSSCSWDSNIDDILSTSCDFNISDMNIGTHLITLDINDSIDIQTKTINIRIKTGLIPTITTPSNNSGSLTNSEISFTSSVDDNYGVYSCSWDSNRDDTLSTSCDFNSSSLSVGIHLITLSVTDDIETVSTTKTITVKTNLLPVISSPSDDSTSASGISINFIGTTDNNFGVYSCSWDSNLYSSFGSGCDINVSDLNVGIHLITLSVTDDLETISTTETIIVKTNLVPSISSPSNGSSYIPGNTINFIGTTDNNFGVYSCSWDSNLYSSFGSGCDINVSDLNVGTHLITLSVTDSLETQTTTQNITVSTPPPELPYIIYDSAKLYIHPIDSSSSIIWGPAILANATSTTNGLSNTNTIVAAYGTHTSYAARLCYELVDSYMGYTDWYLPANDQLLTLYTTGNSGVVKGDFASSWVDFGDDPYWTSTEYSSSDAYIIYMVNGYISDNDKGYNFYVRCVRDP